MKGKQPPKEAPAKKARANPMQDSIDAIPDAAERQRVQDIVDAFHRERVERNRVAVESGDGQALLDATLLALIGRMQFPNWLAQELASAINRYEHHDAFSLDEAFRVSRPTGYRRKAKRDARRVGHVLAHDVAQLIRAGAVVDEALFAAVGRIHGVGKTKAAKWYYTFRDLPFIAINTSRLGRTALAPRLQGVIVEVKWHPDLVP